ncbi:uncharacterized protein [Musca autumnalis]|uniref:uncharacterized protein n=1 Tax=Musca autumnalis TaxID=221902 RepID=UPI003CE955A6
MTTKRATTYGHHTQHQQRRPPDVEEALSSMLWTPYERASITDTSSDDEDELLNRHQQLRKSKSQYDYTSIPTIPPSPTLTPTPLMLPATNLVAYIPTPTHQVVTLPPGVATSTYYAATAEDICDASVTTPLVPLSSLILDAGNGHLTTMAAADELLASSNSTVIAVAVNDAHTTCYPPTPAPLPPLHTSNESTLANDMSSSFTASLENHKNRFSFASYGRITGLNKWWPSSHSSNSNGITATATSSPPISSSAASPLDEAAVLSPSGIGSSTASTALAKSTRPAEPKEPPSYDSLYSKAQQRQQRRQQRRAATTTSRHGKHLNIFKPVLETLKANVSTITQGRFASISSSSSSSSSAFLSRQDNCSSSSSRRRNPNTSYNHGNHNIRHSDINNSLGHVNNPCSSNTCADDGDSSSPGNETHLVHSFTDDFLTEECSTTIRHQQHVAMKNVDNEHIVNTLNNNNNNNNSCSITPIGESTEPAVQEKLQTPQQSGGDRETNTKPLMNHRTNQLLASDEHDQNINKTKTTTTTTKSISQQTDEELEEQETENKQNNNFILYPKQQQQQQHQRPHHHHPHYQPLLGCSDEIYDQSIQCDKMNPMEMNAYREPREFMYSAYCHTSHAPPSTMWRAIPPYDETSTTPTAISLTRSFEVNTTSNGRSVTASAVQRNNTDTFKTSFERSPNKTSAKCSDSTTTTTYNLTPNKCLAELERLYAEFRASESLREQRLRELEAKKDEEGVDGVGTCETTGQRLSGVEISEKNANMRLNVPASNNSTNGGNVEEAVKTSDTTKINPSTSSVFLTTTNSVTALTNPCQRTPSLTIQVNQNTNTSSNNLSNKNTSNNNNNNNNSVGEIILNQAIVNATTATTTTKNGVSVINCNYVNSPINNNNNNNNKSITNLCDIATNTNLNNAQVNLKNPQTPTSISSSSSSSESCSSPIKNNANISDTTTTTKPIVNNSQNSSVPNLLKNNKNNNNNNSSFPEETSHMGGSVNVIQVNGNITAPISRTFTSTECQTDDVASVQLRSPRTQCNATQSATTSATLNNGRDRDQRRRERRERRHLHHTASMMVAPTHSHHPGRHTHLDRHSMPAPPLPPILHPPHMHPGLTSHHPHNVAMMRPMLPDILHNHHFPPPYSALPSHQTPPPPPPPTMGGVSASMSNHHPNGPALTQFAHGCPVPAPPPPGVTLLGPAAAPPPAGTTMLTSVISTVPIPGATPIVNDGRFSLPLPIIRRSPSERSGKGCCGQWFAGPPLRALIAVVALGGVACALGGAALGATGLAGPPSSHFTAALLMIGVGVVLVTVSGAAWRMTAPGGPPCLGLGSSVDLGRCGRRPCSRGGGAPQGLLYPEFQHRPPPPSYQASMQEYRLRLLLLDRDRQNGVVRGSSPPPTYRSHAGSLLRAPLTSTIRGAGGIGATGRAESSIGGSEYSFPPSYRSRNTTPGTISSERSIETEPSGRLLANEDIPEPLSVEQLSEYNTLQQRTIQTRLGTSTTTSANNNTTTTSTTVNTTTMVSGVGSAKSEEKRNSLQLDTNCIITRRDSSTGGDKKDDLVTIVTITPKNEIDTNSNNVESQNSTNLEVTQQSGSREQIEILAHL